MRNLRYIVLISLLLGRVGVGLSQDYSRLSERTIIGTARYVGMSGAMTAIGGDPSAAQDNPAGLGLYRRSEVMLTTDLGIDKTTDRKPALRFSVAQASIVLSLGTGNENKGLIANNLMFSYQRRRTFARQMYGASLEGRSLSRILTSYGIEGHYPSARFYDENSFTFEEHGSINEFGIDWAMNYSNQLYFGLGFRVHSFALVEDAIYREYFDADTTYLFNKTYVSHRGVGFSGALGLIYRPTGWLRIGVGFQTPSVGSLRTYTSGTTETMTDSIYISWAPDKSYPDQDFHLPLRLSTSVAFQISAYGLIALQYDYSHAKWQDDIHSLRAGFEVIPVMGLYINGGYTCESTFKQHDAPYGIDPTFERRDAYSQYPKLAHYASCAIGYRGAYMMVQLAYQYRWQKLDLYAHEYAAPYDIKAETHRIVLTLGWHRH